LKIVNCCTTVVRIVLKKACFACLNYKGARW